MDQTTHVLEAFYRRAHTGQDQEYTCSAFWQLLCQASFPLRQGFAVVCEQSPDDNVRARVDTVISIVEYTTLNITKILLVESKRRGAGTSHITRCESQAHDGCRLYLSTEGLSQVYALTTYGTEFRLWSYSSRMDVLEAVSSTGDTGIDRGNPRDGYLEIKHEMGHNTWETFVATIRGIHSTPQPPPVQQQQHGSFHDQVSASANAFVDEQYPSQLPVSNPAIPPQFAPAYSIPTQSPGLSATMAGMPSGFASAEASSSSNAPNASADRPEAFTSDYQQDMAGGGHSSFQGRGKRYVPIDIQVEKHTTKKDEWCFTDVKQKYKKVVRTEWRKQPVPGYNRPRWCHETDHHIYYAAHDP